MNRNLHQCFFQRKIPSPVSKYVTSQTQTPLNEQEIDPLEERQCNATTSIYGKHSHDPSPKESKTVYQGKEALAKRELSDFPRTVEYRDHGSVLIPNQRT